MDLGRQCVYTGIWSSMIERHVKEKMLLLWSKQDSHRSDVRVPILVWIDPFERAVGG